MSSVNISDIGPNIWQYYRVNIESGTSKSDTILPIYIGLGRYFKLWKTHFFSFPHTNSFHSRWHEGYNPSLLQLWRRWRRLMVAPCKIHRTRLGLWMPVSWLGFPQLIIGRPISQVLIPACDLVILDSVSLLLPLDGFIKLLRWFHSNVLIWDYGSRAKAPPNHHVICPMGRMQLNIDFLTCKNRILFIEAQGTIPYRLL